MIGRSSRRESGVAGTGSVLPPPVIAPPDRRAPAPPPPRRVRRRRSRGERILKVTVIFVALVLVLGGALYGYLRYRLGQIKSIKCTACAAVANGQPYNVLVVGSDTRAGNTGAAAKAFGRPRPRSAGSAATRSRSSMSIRPRVRPGCCRSPATPMSPCRAFRQARGLATDNKINTAFNDGPDPLIQTIENTFGIPIAHFVIIDFTGVINLVNSVGGINLNFPYPVRDNDDGNNNSGLDITHCRLPDAERDHGAGACPIALLPVRGTARLLGVRRQSSDLGRIQRQNTIIEAVIDKAKIELQPLHRQRVHRVDRPRRHQGRRRCPAT